MKDTHFLASNIYVLLAFVLLISGCATSIQPHSEPLSYAHPAPVHAKAWKELLANLPGGDGSSSFLVVLFPMILITYDLTN